MLHSQVSAMSSAPIPVLVSGAAFYGWSGQRSRHVRPSPPNLRASCGAATRGLALKSARRASGRPAAALARSRVLLPMVCPMSESFSSLVDTFKNVGVSRAFGPATNIAGEEIVPVAMVSFGFGGGSSPEDGQPGVGGSGGGGGGFVLASGRVCQGPRGNMAFRPEYRRGACGADSAGVCGRPFDPRHS